MRHLSIFLKPSSGLCNINCTYCFYKEEKTKKLHTTFMEFDTFKHAYDKAIKIAEHISIGFQGGEPLLIGYDFYRKVIDYTKQFSNKTHFSLQTNGILITEEFAKLFYKNNFLIGVSLDGNKSLHNKLRQKYNDTIIGIELLKKHKVNFNILSVVTNDFVDNLDEVLSELEQYKYLQFIPCLDKDNETFLTHQNYTKFLKQSFDFYIKKFKEEDPVSIQFFDNTYVRHIDQEPQVCTMKGRCSTQFVIEANGDVYSCDFYVDEDHKIGNINQDSYQNMFEDPINQNFLKESFNTHQKCQSCEYLYLCRGGCKKNQEEGLNVYCDSLKEFYKYSQQGFNLMKETLLK